jgi:starch phosphorylase
MVDALDDSAQLDRITTLDDLSLWWLHLVLKEKLFGFMRDDARRRFADDWKDAAQVVGAGVLFDQNAFTIGFARRFATYKRANLIFRDPERLHRLLVDARRPVQLVVAGKAHPADTPGKQVLQNAPTASRTIRSTRAGRVRGGLRHVPRASARAGAWTSG